MEIYEFCGLPPLDFYTAAWEIKDTNAAPIITVMKKIHEDLIVQTVLPIAWLRYALFVNRKKEMEENLLDAQSLSACIKNVLSQSWDFVRVDGAFFAVAIEPTGLCNMSFCSFFNVSETLSEIFFKTIGNTKALPGKSKLIATLQNYLNHYPKWDRIVEYQSLMENLWTEKERTGHTGRPLPSN